MGNAWEMLQEYRKRNGLTDKQVAERLKAPLDTYRRWHHRNPSAHYQAEINRLLGVGAEIFSSAPNTAIPTNELPPPPAASFAGGTGSSPTVDTRASTRISDELALRLLAQHEIVRDPVWGDIWITALERAIIDAPAFQRLRLLKQLGPTHLVYPGAVHTRFLHSIGTVHCVEQLIRTANRNHEVYLQGHLQKK